LADRDAGITGDKAGLEQARDRMYSFQRAKEALGLRQQAEVQTGKVGVDLAVEANNLRNQERLSPSAVRRATGRNFLEFGGVWIDEGFDATMAAVAVRAQSPAYFRILERHPAAKDVYRLGNYVLWVTPGRTALVIDVRDGRDEMSDAEIDRLFAAAK
jgi:Ca-activated chloride channel family protein